MDKRLGYAFLGFALCAAPAFSQRVQTRRATMSLERGDTGKCTIEVEVDGTAEVELFGDIGRLRTLAGAPAVWRRFECNGPMPGNPADFRFSGVDGRGSQTLVADPRGNGGVAVVRIDDPKGGREGYTFDIRWRGGYGAPYYRGSTDDRGYDGPFNGGPYIEACQAAVKDRARGEYGYRDIRFYEVDSTYNQRPRDFVSGTFEGRRDGQVDQFRYTCSVNGGGRVKSVDIQPLNGDGGYSGGGLSPSDDPYGSDDMVRRCEDAVADRVGRDGYGDLQFRWADTNDRRGRVEGTVSARRDSRGYDLDFSCSVDDTGRVRSVDIRRR